MPTIQEPITTIPELDFKIINFPNKLIFIAWRAGEPINNVNTDIKSDDFLIRMRIISVLLAVHWQIKLVWCLVGIDLDNL